MEKSELLPHQRGNGLSTNSPTWTIAYLSDSEGTSCLTRVELHQSRIFVLEFSYIYDYQP